MKTPSGVPIKLALMAGLAVLATASCDSGVNDPSYSLLAVTPLERFVAMGGSFTAGVQGDGISVSTQRQSWAAIVAKRARTDFVQPMFTEPGCHAPYTSPLTRTASGCSGRVDPDEFDLNNVAVPNEHIGDAVDGPVVLADPHAMMLGPRSQMQAMMDYKPTFVGVELGFHDVLDAALLGSTGGELPSARVFSNAVNALVAQLQSLPRLKDAILFSVLDPTLYAPMFQPGTYYFLARDAAGRFNGKPVNVNCSPVTMVGTPNPLSANLVAFSESRGAASEINCDPAAGRQPLLTASEVTLLRQRIAEFNAALQQAATANGWLYFDLNALFASYRSSVTSGRYNELRMCQGLPTATTAAQFQAAVLNTCPVTGGTGAPNFFGSAVTFDGVTPSAATSQAVARAVMDSLNARYGTSL